jgi:hypothetical protein
MVAAKTAKRVYAGEFPKKLDSLASTLIQKVMGAWPARLSHLNFAQRFFISTLRAGRYTFGAIQFLCANQTRDSYGWQWEYLIVLPAVNRTILDSLFNVVFMLEDLETRSGWYHKS